MRVASMGHILMKLFFSFALMSSSRVNERVFEYRKRLSKNARFHLSHSASPRKGEQSRLLKISIDIIEVLRLNICKAVWIIGYAVSAFPAEILNWSSPNTSEKICM